ncbi:hypothetical protein TNCV_4060051 [Trichonephila clavipes]|nr:hypothetical protein TNCV_4060051 [Trichonephila clavipes]
MLHPESLIPQNIAKILHRYTASRDSHHLLFRRSNQSQLRVARSAVLTSPGTCLQSSILVKSLISFTRFPTNVFHGSFFLIQLKTTIELDQK